MATIEIQVPTALSDITLEQYLQYEALPENLNDIDRATETIFIFTPLSRGEVSNLSMSDRTAILRMLRQMIGTREHELILHGKLEGVSVSFVPNLDNITLGEFIDIEKYQSDAKNWAMLMQVLYRPLVEHQPLDKYKVLTYEQTLELQLDYSKITMDMVFGALVFFCDLGNDLINSILKSLSRTQKQPSTNMTLGLSGDGSESLSSFLRATLDELTKYHASLYIKL